MKFNENTNIGPFTGADVAFIHKAFGKNLVSRDDLTMILSDQNLRQPLLDSRRLFEELKTETPQLDVSYYLFYYLQVRQALLKAKLLDPKLSEYITSLVVDLAGNQHEKFTVRGIKVTHYIPLRMGVGVNEGESVNTVKIQADVGNLKLIVDGHYSPQGGSTEEAE
jgi:hypothetical protein